MKHKNVNDASQKGLVLLKAYEVSPKGAHVPFMNMELLTAFGK